MLMTLDEVRSKYSSGPVKLVDGNGGLPMLQVRTPLAEADIYLHGSHITHFRPQGHDPVLFMSKSSNFAAGKPIRGGVPVCGPWFGAKKDDSSAPGHGIFRLQSWSVQSISTLPHGDVEIALQLLQSDLSRKYWPYNFTIEHRIRIGKELSMSLTMKNTDSRTFTFDEALHTYFVVGDIKQVSVSGLKGVQYIDKAPDMQRLTQQEDPIRFTAETDRHYVKTTATTTIDDPSPAMRRRITIAKFGSKSTVVWNPWIAKSKAMPDFGDDEWPGMLCVETANAADDQITLTPGQSHLMQAFISVEKL